MQYIKYILLQKGICDDKRSAYAERCHLAYKSAQRTQRLGAKRVQPRIARRRRFAAVDGLQRKNSSNQISGRHVRLHGPSKTAVPQSESALQERPTKNDRSPYVDRVSR